MRTPTEEDEMFNLFQKSDRAEQSAKLHKGAAAKASRFAREERAQARRARVEQLKATAGEAKDSVASSLKEKVIPAVGTAAATAKHKTVEGGARAVEVTAPKLQQAMEATAPKIDSTRDKIVDDVLPKIQDMLDSAVEASSRATDRAARAAGDLVDERKDEAKKLGKQAKRSRKQAAKRAASLSAKQDERKGGKAKALLAIAGVSAAGAATAAVLKRRKEQQDPWSRPLAAAGESQDKGCCGGKGKGKGCGGGKGTHEPQGIAVESVAPMADPLSTMSTTHVDSFDEGQPSTADATSLGQITPADGAAPGAEGGVPEGPFAATLQSPDVAAESGDTTGPALLDEQPVERPDDRPQTI